MKPRKHIYLNTEACEVLKNLPYEFNLSEFVSKALIKMDDEKKHATKPNPTISV